MGSGGGASGSGTEGSGSEDTVAGGDGGLRDFRFGAAIAAAIVGNSSIGRVSEPIPVGAAVRLRAQGASGDLRGSEGRLGGTPLGRGADGGGGGASAAQSMDGGSAHAGSRASWDRAGTGRLARGAAAGWMMEGDGVGADPLPFV
jgi:hypothetical protein